MTASNLQRVAAGDAAAVNDVLDRYGGLVWTLARRMSADASDAEDAVQEIFIDVWRSAGRFDPANGSEANFVAMIARRRLVDRHRQRARKLPLVQSLSDQAAADVPQSADRPPWSEVLEEASRARESMNSLKQEERRVLEMAVYDGLSQNEIASRMNLPLGTVKTHSRRGLIRLRELLGVAATVQAKGDVR